MENNTFIVDDGLQKFEFKNKNGEVFAEMFFNPSDTSVIERYEKVVDVLNALELKHSTREEIQDSLVVLSNTFKEQFDYLLNRDNSDSLFRTYSPITIFANGDYFAEVILENLTKVIEKEYNIRLKKKIKKMEKYTKKYIK